MPILTRALTAGGGGGGGGDGEINTGFNLGAGPGEVFAQKNGVNLEFRSLQGTNDIGITQSATEIAISGALLLPLDGSRAMTGALDMGSQIISNAGAINGALLSSSGVATDYLDETGSYSTPNSVFTNVAAVTGIISGGLVTANVDTTKFDVAAGVAHHADPNDPTAIPTSVAFGPFVGITPDDIATQTATILSISPAGLLLQQIPFETPEDRRTNALLQDVSHADLTNITSISTSQQPAFNVQQSLIDYVKLLGAINSGNQYAAAASDLTISKSAGTSNLPFLNGALSATNPNEQINAAADPTGFLQIYIDSTQPGGFNISPQTDVPAGSWDDGSDTLATVGMNNWAIYWMDFFNNVSALTIGQAEYNTLAAAEAALFTENPITLPAIDAVPNTRRTAIIVKGNASDLSVQPGQAKFVPIQMGVTGGASAVLSVFGRTGIVTSAAGDYIASQITFTPDGDIAAVEVQAAIVEVRDDTDTKLALKADASVVITAGAGLTGGGDLSASRTLDVVATDASIVVVADSLAVGVLQTDAMHGVRGGGTQHADVIAGGADGFMTGADKTKLDGIAAGAAALTAAAPADVTKAAAAVGVATLAARADHKHDISTAAAVNVGTANAEGSATSLSRSDHVHAHAAQTDGTLHADVIAGGADGFMTGADKTKLNGIEALADVTDLANVTAAGAAILAGQAGGQILIGGTATGDDLTLESTSFATKGDVIVAAGSAFLLNDMAAPANPSAGQGRLYKKTGDDGVFWKPDAAGPEVDLTANTGEVNTASNQGTVSLVLTKSGVDLPFRGLAGINNIGVAINGNDVEISGSLLAIAARDMIAGAGLTGGGDLSADRTFNVIANGDASIVVNANDIQVGVLATDAQHGVRGGGTQHADVIAGGADGFMTGADKTKLDGIATAAAALTGAAPADVTKAAAAVGVATLAARADHKHDISTAAAVNVGTVNAEGSATSLSRSDHVHAHAAQTDGTLHADVVAGGADGFMTGARAQLQDDMALFREWVPGGKLISITNSSWVITVNAPAVASAANAEKTVRVFDDTDDEGAGYELFVPTGATDVVFTMVTRPVSSPGGAVTSTWAVYEKDFGDDAVPGSWSAANALTTANHASGNLNVQYDETSFTLAGLGVAANQLHLLEFVRSGGTLTGDAELLGVLVEVV